MELTKGQGVELKASQRSAPEVQLGRDPHKSRASLWSGCQSVESYSRENGCWTSVCALHSLISLTRQTRCEAGVGGGVDGGSSTCRGKN